MLFIILGRVGFIKGTAVDNDPTIIFNSTFTVNFLRIQNTAPTPYLIVIGYKIMNIQFAPYPTYVDYTISVVSTAQTSFNLRAYCSS